MSTVGGYRWLAFEPRLTALAPVDRRRPCNFRRVLVITMYVPLAARDKQRDRFKYRIILRL